MSRKSITRTLVTFGLAAGTVTISAAPAAAVDNRVAAATALEVGQHVSALVGNGVPVLRTPPDSRKGGFCLKYFGVGTHITSVAVPCDPIRLVIPS
jgi:hypothetical protein